MDRCPKLEHERVVKRVEATGGESDPDLSDEYAAGMDGSAGHTYYAPSFRLECGEVLSDVAVAE